ncbi:conserved hypothetical protein [Talaromyces stipitatus ATCC 10500]|uniref:Sugar phosphate transporter domain-containing protein n=1 Tax=Talaromyces stipitatus (strain ATCC 10500 / CBS 375.48 / QM 6759 / NRRL 1006) TaxID=441959 RepID=B8MLQ9_TALSN|nr:uncharacterized protein TSTA_098870 [Talaromyces stipitatus ATCC 10500]XP_002485870.1 uncharacterized protein TSTA_098870 [Talaromyces stipitatus ATCC 10500]EED13631.1 conserved hypothetical protein [Talaromyces stipitatus ATCC 10500]EED13632.1 conserved hypothetical protein [Talaromyces stipitatus ATCC 10500]
MTDTYEISIFDSSDDDISLAAAEEVGLLASQQSHRRTSSIDHFVTYTRRTVSDLLSDLDFIHNALSIALLAVLWHMFSLAISVYNKWMFSGDIISFPFPLFMTSLHQAVQFCLSALFLYLVPSLRPQRNNTNNSTLPSPAVLPGADLQKGGSMSIKRLYLIHLIPGGVATALDMGLGNMSLRFSSLTFMTACKSSTLVFILLFAFLFGLERPSARLALIIAVMTAGEVMMVLGEVTFSLPGFALVTGSAFFSGFRWALSQLLILKHPATSNPVSMLFHLSPVVFITLIGISISVEDPNEIIDALYALSETCGSSATAISLLLLPGCLAFCMVLSQFALLQRSSVVTLSVCGILKEVVIIGVAGMVFGDKLTSVNICGVVAIMASVIAYNYMKIKAARKPVREKWVGEKYS